jgi:cobalt/nickel transport protein
VNRPRPPWVRPALAVVFALAVLAPVFGWASAAVGYAEPLWNAAETVGAAGAERTLIPGLFPDYSVPGLPGPLGTLVAAVVGAGLTLAITTGIGRVLEP